MQDEDPDQILANYSKTLLPCKADQHSWSRNYVWELIDPRTLERQQVCRDCKLLRYTEVDFSTGARLTNFKYRGYPRGYITSGSGLKKADFQQRLNHESIAKAVQAGKVHGAPDPKLEEKRAGKKAS